MKLFVVACLAFAAFAVAEDNSSFETSPVYGYHRRAGIPLAAEIQRAEAAEIAAPGRIVGGSITDISQVPYQAGLVLTINWFWQSVCGGSLISNNRVITAAHCQHDGENTATSITVVLGTNTIFTGGVRIVTRDVTMHPRWNPRNADSDIAVIRISSVTFSNVIQAINLPDAHLNNNFVGSTALASGWGRTSDGSSGGISNTQRISSVNLPIITNAECTAYYGPWMHATNICTSGAGGQGTCGGDSGGPLVVNVNGNVLVGVTSYGSTRGCQAGEPAAFARVTSFVSWIRSI